VNRPADDLTIRVTAHRPVTSRSAFERAIEGKGLGAVEGRSTVPLASLEEDGNGGRYLPLPVAAVDAPAAEDPGPILPGRSGVYPLLVELRRRGVGTLDSFVTPLTVIAPGVVPLTVAWVWRLDATPARTPDGQLGQAAARAMAPGGRLARMVEAAAGSPETPLTLAPTPETVDAWNAKQPLTHLRELFDQPGRELLGGPYVTPNLPGLSAAGLDSEVDAQFRRGAETLERALGRGASTGTLLAGPVDQASLGRLRNYGVERLVLDPAALEAHEQRLTPGKPFLLGGGSGSARGRTPSYKAAVTDPALAGLLTGNSPPALRAARFLAALSLVALEAPRQERGVVVVTPPGWDPPARLLTAVLGGLRSSPALQPSTLHDFFENVAPEAASGRTLVRRLAEEDGAGVDATRLRAARDRLASFSSLMGGGQPIPATADHALLTSQAASLRSSASEAYVAAVEGTIRGITGKVRGPDRQRVTLTARRASIPISLLNPNSEPLRVLVRLESDQLQFPEGAERLLTLPPRNTTEKFVVEARSSGAFPLIIHVTSPDGGLLVSRSEITVRSTVVSGVGALLTASAGVFLLVWWANHLRRARRDGSRPRRRLGRDVADDEQRIASAVPTATAAAVTSHTG
jgi:hypothetical protein